MKYQKPTEEQQLTPAVWDELKRKYPKAMKAFGEWIDDYKVQVGWSKLFNSDSEYQNSSGENAPAPKFHDLPSEMQFGIYIRFFMDILGPNSGQSLQVDNWLVYSIHSATLLIEIYLNNDYGTTETQEAESKGEKKEINN